MAAYVYNKQKPDGTFYSGPEEGFAPSNPTADAAPPVPTNPSPTKYVLNAEGTAYGEDTGQGINRTIVEDPAESFLNNSFKQPESREQIAERLRKESQGLIESTNKVFDDEVARKTQIGKERLSMDNAMAVMTGNAGGTESIHSRKTVTDANEKEVQAVNNQRAQALASIFSNISAEARTEARQQQEDATRSAEQVLARRKESQTKAVENIKTIASSGLVDFDAFAQNAQNKEVYDYALKAFGGSEQALKAHFMLNRPQEQLLGTPQRIGNKYVQAYTNPVTGKVKYEQLDLPFDLPPEYTGFQKMGDNLVAIPEGWDGDVSKLVTVVGKPSTEDQLRQESLRMDIALKNKELNKSDEKPLTYEQQEKENAKAQQQTVAVNRATEVQDLVKKIKDSGDINSITGKWEWRRNLPGGKQDTLADLERLKALLAIDAIKDFKGLGPMSEREFGTASAAASSLDVTRTSSGFGSELDRINTAMETIKTGLGGSAAPDGNADALRSQLQHGEILVRDKATGQIGAVMVYEFDADKYDAI